MQRTSLWMAFILVSLCFSNSYAVSADDSETDECWVIVKEITNGFMKMKIWSQTTLESLIFPMIHSAD